jgi:hypothetical protein
MPRREAAVRAAWRAWRRFSWRRAWRRRALRAVQRAAFAWRGARAEAAGAAACLRALRLRDAPRRAPPGSAAAPAAPRRRADAQQPPPPPQQSAQPRLASQRLLCRPQRALGQKQRGLPARARPTCASAPAWRARRRRRVSHTRNAQDAAQRCACLTRSGDSALSAASCASRLASSAASSAAEASRISSSSMLSARLDAAL